jgi:putative Holliday junction resolvase
MKRVIGVDLGGVRTGIAVSDELRMLAHPRETLDSGNVKTLVQNVVKRVTLEDADTVVVGLPRNMDGTSGPATEKVKQFAELLQAATSARVILWDERLTTLAAQRALHQAGKDVRSSRKMIDQVAAQILLQSWLDTQDSGWNNAN